MVRTWFRFPMVRMALIAGGLTLALSSCYYPYYGPFVGHGFYGGGFHAGGFSRGKFQGFQKKRFRGFRHRRGGWRGR